MRDANVFAISRAMPRMSWSPRNLYNLWQRSYGPRAQDARFTRTSKTLFQQRWTAKALVRAYHGDYINEKIFKRWYLPQTLPDVRPRIAASAEQAALEAFAGREARRRRDEQEKGMAPVGSLMLAEVERRIDVFLFRCCFAHSVYEARRLVVHGYVMLNGKKHSNANTRLAPGDMITVDPKAIRFLQKPKDAAVEVEAEAESAADVVAEEAAAETAPAEPTPEQTSAAAAAEAEAEAASAPAEGEGEASSTPAPTTPKPKSTKPTKSTPRQPWEPRTPPSSTAAAPLTPFHPPAYSAPWLFVPAFAEVSFATCSAVYVRHPTARPGYSEIPTPYDADGEIVRLAWEWYVKVRPRNRSRSQWEREPENRQ
ncbi:alpha-L RNA-binding motif-containing protein [Coniophora puteana RWD-64-598 SS2]|uniref:Alpha-L RNA-binding motif-containing protein n=1 Tax=Coniophora puteana (strain RWD-64-598) TaxID=741705 RepID=A0A5M3MAP3_CONPW|nr:alpha-L RNA-binding motif-containing protein [Coniophora puteana RWD-64-598 SS2]EIW75934.1 alpha-L RNA-binding motif-containing protein [Coniophora puteana RWD-64-598 SS2]